MGVIAAQTVLVAVVGYLLGSINTSLVVGRFYGVDVRKHGSGNAGMTNTLRTLGKLPAVLVIAGDVLKGVLACLIGLFVTGDVKDIGYIGVMAGGISAIIGHNWPLYFGFKGGKGILTSFAVVLMMDWRIGLILFGVFLVVVLLTRYISLGSVTASVLFPLVSLLPVFGQSYIFSLFASVLALMAIYRHRSNIVRIVNGTESKFGEKKKSVS